MDQFLTLLIFLLGLMACLMTTMTKGMRYDGDEVLQVFIDGDEQWTSFSQLQQLFQQQVTTWRQPVQNDESAHVHVPNDVKDAFKEELQKLNVSFRTMIEDLQQLIDSERESNPTRGIDLPWTKTKKNGTTSSRRRRRRRRQTSVDAGNDALPEVDSIVGKYATYEEVYDWLKDLTTIFPNLTSLQVIGKTFQGRDLFLFKIGDPNSKTFRPGVWVDAGTHAREWITISSAVYIISQILSDHYLQTPQLNLTGSVDWYFAPILNPDGYAFTYAPNGTRLWRKNRSVYDTSYSTFYNMSCHGTDINRNYDIMWNTVGTATDPCVETYGGPWAASENETQAVMAYLVEHNETIRATVTLHSYAQLFMIRWSYSIDAPPPPEFNETLKVAEEVVAAINQTNGVVYQAGRAPQILYAFSGGEGDWVRAKAGIKNAYEVELRDTGTFGFILPADLILPVGEEIWNGIKVVASHIVDEYPPVLRESATNDTGTTTSLSSSPSPSSSSSSLSDGSTYNRYYNGVELLKSNISSFIIFMFCVYSVVN